MGGGSIGARRGTMGTRKRGGGIYSARGGGGKVMRSPGKKILLYAGYFLDKHCCSYLLMINQSLIVATAVIHV